jgi:hypothetical protein
MAYRSDTISTGLAAYFSDCLKYERLGIVIRNSRARTETQVIAPEAQSPPQYGRPGKNPTKVSDVLGEKVPGTWQRPVQRPRSSTPASEVLNAHSTRVS